MSATSHKSLWTAPDAKHCAVGNTGFAEQSGRGAGADRDTEPGGLEALLVNPAALLQAPLHFHEGDLLLHILPSASRLR